MEEEELQFSRQAARIRNPHVHKAHFRTVGDSGMEVRTTTHRSDSSTTGITTLSPLITDDASHQPDLMDDKDDLPRKQTQVCSVC